MKKHDNPNYESFVNSTYSELFSPRQILPLQCPYIDINGRTRTLIETERKIREIEDDKHIRSIEDRPNPTLDAVYKAQTRINAVYTFESP